MRSFIKICGVRTVEDALACVGADAVGFNLYGRSKRYVTPEAARIIVAALPITLRRFAVLVNASDEEVAAAATFADTLQLHGDETPQRQAELQARYPRLTVMKAVRLKGSLDLAALDAYSGLLLVDADSPDYGGSGVRADVELARSLAQRRPILLAGGLDPDNVAEAVRAVRPAGVDVAGGVESSPGSKDHTRISAFITRARAVFLED